MMLAMEESQLSQTSLFSSSSSNSMELFSQSQSQTTAGTYPVVAMVTVAYVT